MATLIPGLQPQGAGQGTYSPIAAHHPAWPRKDLLPRRRQLPRIHVEILGDAFQGLQGEVAFAALDAARVGAVHAQDVGGGPGQRRGAEGRILV